MATAKAGPRRTPRRVTLRLTEGEADLILGLTGLIGGEHKTSARKYSDRIRKALGEALGYDYDGTDAYVHAIGHLEVLDYDTPEVTMTDRAMAYLNVMDIARPREIDELTEVGMMMAAMTRDNT